MIEEVRFAADSLLEGTGFEPLVPLRDFAARCAQAKARADQIPGVLVTTGPGTPTASRFAPAQTDREHSNGRTKLPGDMKGESDAE